MGYLQERTGFRILGKTPPGTCPECAAVHAPEAPHNRDSLAYQYIFYDREGRWPTWADATAHCTQEVKDVWTAALEKRGVSIE